MSDLDFVAEKSICANPRLSIYFRLVILIKIVQKLFACLLLYVHFVFDLQFVKNSTFLNVAPKNMKH